MPMNFQLIRFMDTFTIRIVSFHKFSGINTGTFVKRTCRFCTLSVRNNRVQILVVIIIIFTSPFGVPCHTPSARTKVLHSGQCRIQGRGPGGPAPPSCQTNLRPEGPKKLFLRPAPPPPPHHLIMSRSGSSTAGLLLYPNSDVLKVAEHSFAGGQR